MSPTAHPGTLGDSTAPAAVSPAGGLSLPVSAWQLPHPPTGDEEQSPKGLNLGGHLVCGGLAPLLPTGPARSAAPDLHSDEDLGGVLLNLLSNMNFSISKALFLTLLGLAEGLSCRERGRGSHCTACSWAGRAWILSGLCPGHSAATRFPNFVLADTTEGFLRLDGGVDVGTGSV